MKIKSLYKRWPYRFSISGKQLRDHDRNQRIILFGTPEYGNLGDHAIAQATHAYLNRYFSDYTVIEITQAHLMWDQNRIFSDIKETDLILYTGGGFLGSLWMAGGEDLVRLVLKKLPENKIIILPQTIFFEKNAWGVKQREISRSVYQTHKNLTLCLRDQASYDYVRKHHLINTDRCYFVPDMVTFMDKKNYGYHRNRILLCLREDKEKLNNINMDEITMLAKRLGEKPAYTTTRLSHDIPLSQRDSELEKKYREFSEAKLVVTNRLHGMLICAICGTPCLAFDNLSGKVKGAYQWISYLDYIIMPDNFNVTDHFAVIKRMIERPHQFTNEPIQKSQNILNEIIQSELNEQ